MIGKRAMFAALVGSATLLWTAAPCWSQSFAVVDLVTDDPAAHPAQITDPGLLNAWGMSYAPTGPFWVSSNGGGTVDLYS